MFHIGGEFGLQCLMLLLGLYVVYFLMRICLSFGIAIVVEFSLRLNKLCMPLSLIYVFT